MRKQVADTRVAGVGTGGMSAADNLALPENNEVVGHLEPLLGRVAKRDVTGYFGFPLIRAGQAVTPAIFEKAQSQGKLYEVIASTEDL
jgi:hypothetical protein